MERIGILIVAGGSGTRMGSTLPKQFMLLGGRPVLAHAIDRFAQALPGAPIVVVLPEEHLAFWRNLAARFDVPRHTLTAGGPQRFHSVSRGLAALPPGLDFIAVHDGVRPLVSAALIRRTVDAARTHGAAIPAVEPVDSFRMTGDGNSHPLDRCRLRAVQTPQVFRAGLLRNAYETTYRPDFTDDASVVEHSGTTVFLCEGERRNLKITTPDDLLCAEALLAEELSAAEESPEESSADNNVVPQSGTDKADDHPTPCCDSCPCAPTGSTSCPTASDGPNLFPEGCSGQAQSDAHDGCCRACRPSEATGESLPGTPQTTPGSKRPNCPQSGCCHRKR